MKEISKKTLRAINYCELDISTAINVAIACTVAKCEIKKIKLQARRGLMARELYLT